MKDYIQIIKNLSYSMGVIRTMDVQHELESQVEEVAESIDQAIQYISDNHDIDSLKIKAKE